MLQFDEMDQKNKIKIYDKYAEYPNISKFEKNFFTPKANIYLGKTYTPKIKFIENRKKFYILSIFFAIISIFSLWFKELNFGIDFKGGLLVEIKLENNIELESLRYNIEALNYGDFTLQKLDNSNDNFLIKIELSSDFQTAEFVEKHGFVDRVIQRKDLQEEIGKLLSILLRKNSDIHLENLNENSETNIQTREAS